MSVSGVVLSNARVVLADRVIGCGWVAVMNGRIVEIGEGDAPERGKDLAGDLLLPGLVELHTDHLEAHYMPRPKVYWDAVAAVVSYDGQLATCGITTVLDSLRVWREEGAEEVDGQAEILAEAIATARQAELLRIEHFLHLRCEVPMPSVVAETQELIGRQDVRLLSLMDHTPGQRQFRDERKLRDYYRARKVASPMSSSTRCSPGGSKTGRARQANHAGRRARARPHTPLPATTTRRPSMSRRRSATACRSRSFRPRSRPRSPARAGISMLMGAPNLVLGGSHSGNVSAADLVKQACSMCSRPTTCRRAC